MKNISIYICEKPYFIFTIYTKKTIEGRSEVVLDKHDLHGGARINFIFNEIFSKSLRSARCSL
jgi:hypothetical protein